MGRGCHQYLFVRVLATSMGWTYVSGQEFDPIEPELNQNSGGAHQHGAPLLCSLIRITIGYCAEISTVTLMLLLSSSAANA